MKRIFVTGIGTGIGKTVVAAILAEALRADYWKPVQAGDTDGTDTEKVKQLVSNSASRFYTEAFRLKAPLSPHDSAQREGIEIDLTGIRIPSTQNTLIIEGAGGLMVPLNKTCLIVDLIRQLDAGVVLVCKNYLGSINHTLMSCEILKTRNIPVLGIVFNGDSYPQGEEVILNRTGYKKILHLKPESAINKKTIETYAKILMGNGSLNPTDPHNTSSSYVNLAEEDRKTVWHPYTQMKSAEPAIPIVSGKNAWLYDHNGNGYIDAISSWWVNLHGHAHPYIAQKLYEQANRLEHVIFAGFTHPPAVHLAGQLLQVLPAGQEKIFYSDNGSTAVEVALKMALQYWYNTGTPNGDTDAAAVIAMYSLCLLIFLKE